MSEADYRTPGQLIKDLMKERGWTQLVLSILLGVDKSIVSKVIAGTKKVNAELALSLSEVFEKPPEEFLDLQMSFDLAQANVIKRPNPNRIKLAKLLSGLPVLEMMKRGWLGNADISNLPEFEKSLSRFFEGNSADGLDVIPHAAKKTNAADSATPTQLAWLFRVRKIAGEMLVPLYTKQKMRSAVTKLKELRNAPENTRHVPRILAEAGVRFVIVESLKSSKIDGVCFWLNESSPVIGMSLRFDRIDNFWFVLRHEIEHVLRDDGKSEIIVDFGLEGENGGDCDSLPEQERVANNAAAQFCVSQNMLDKFIKRKSPIFSVRDLLGFSKMQSVHPGIVVGQLHRQTGRYEVFRKYLVPIRKNIAPSATVDGWGDIPPLD